MLADSVLGIDHVGSTSVPGLAAKPILDIVLVVDDPGDEAKYVPPLHLLGFGLVIRDIFLRIFDARGWL